LGKVAGKTFCSDNRFPYNFAVPKATHDYISTTEAGEILGISRQRVLKFVQDGRLKAIKVANVYLIKKRDLADVKDRKPGRPTKSKGRHK
jgi:excisionase family DNA binding protein